MGKLKRITIGALLVSTAICCVAAGSATRRGTAVLHYMTRGSLVPTELSADAAGTLRLQCNQQGKGQLQKFDLRLTGLAPDGDHLLVAVMGDDTEGSVVGAFSSDAQGRARVSYMKNGNGKGSARKAMPAGLEPLTGVRAIAIANTETQILAQVWIADSASFQYLVKRNLTPADENGPAAGSIDLKANAETIRFRLMANGLTPAGTYHLALNDVIVASLTADEDGWIQISEWPAGAPAVLELTSLALLDDASNVVLSTALPK